MFGLPTVIAAKVGVSQKEWYRGKPSSLCRWVVFLLFLYK